MKPARYVRNWSSSLPGRWYAGVGFCKTMPDSLVLADWDNRVRRDRAVLDVMRRRSEPEAIVGREQSRRYSHFERSETVIRVAER